MSVFNKVVNVRVVALKPYNNGIYTVRVTAGMRGDFDYVSTYPMSYDEAKNKANFFKRESSTLTTDFIQDNPGIWSKVS